MRIGLNATCFNDRPSGANQRFFGIYGALIRQRPDIEFIVYEPVEHRIADWFGGAPNVTARMTPIPSVGRIARLRAGRAYWKPQLHADWLDLFETFHLPMLRAPNCPTVLTIHDLRPIHAAEPPVLRWASRLVMRRAFERADHVITVSDAVKDEIRAFSPSTSVSTIYNGVDATAFAASRDQIAAVRRRFDLPERFVLAVGHLEVRKNLGLLVEAVGRLHDLGHPVPLAIVGNDGGVRAALLNQIAERGLASVVRLIGGSDDATVRALYAAAAMVAFPSRYEGFGIPILEAMATGTPMVLSDTPVFREITKGRALYFSPDDPNAAAAAIKRLWNDPAARAQQIEWGRTRVEDFGFDRLADQLGKLYERLVARPTLSAPASRLRPASGE